MEITKKRVLYLDVLKAIAICAVLVDHFCVLFPNPNLMRNSSAFSVSVFIVAAGITTYHSIPRHVDKIIHGGYMRYRLGSMLCTYVVACFAYYAVSHDLVISDVYDFWITLISFSAPGASYYIVLYAQLVLISPLLYILVRKAVRGKASVVRTGTLLACSLILGYVLTARGVVLPYYGGAKYLLCGSYLFLFVFGMVWAAWDIPCWVLRFGFGNMLALISLYTAFWYCMERGWSVNLFDAWGYNPPGICLIWYALSIVWCVTAFVLYTEKSAWISRYVLQPVQRVGKNSMDIFLFHNVVFILADIYLPSVIRGRLRSILLLTLAVVVPMVGRMGYEKLKKWVVLNLEIKD